MRCLRANNSIESWFLRNKELKLKVDGPDSYEYTCCTLSRLYIRRPHMLREDEGPGITIGQFGEERRRRL